MITVHSSALKRLLNCNGSRLVAGALSPVISGGDEGKTATFAAHAILKGSDPATLVGTAAPSGLFITSEMVDAAIEFATAVRIPGSISAVVDCDVSFGDEKGKWFVNCVADHISLMGQTLCVDQFAYGWGVIEPDNNYDLIAAAIGYCQKFKVTPETIVLTIHQPRPAHPLGTSREIVLEYKALMRHAASIAETLSSPSEIVRSGLSWCRKCPALNTCPAARGAAMNAIDYAAQFAEETIDNDTLARELDELNRAESAIANRKEALEREAQYRVKMGQPVGNYQVGPAKGNRTWNAGLNAQMLQMLTGKDLRKDALITPAQAIIAGVDESVIDSLCHRPDRGIRLFKADPNKLAKKILKG